MSRIKELFEKKKGPILNVYCTAGYPQLDSTLPVMKALEQTGADIIELGMPYSDPLADGPVIQASSSAALQNGMTISKMFDQLTGMRKAISIPVILMGYLNPLLQYGFEKFCAKASEKGIDGLIIPDIPIYEYEKGKGVSRQPAKKRPRFYIPGHARNIGGEDKTTGQAEYRIFICCFLFFHYRLEQKL